MLRVLTKEEMQEADRWTSEEMHIPSAVLMERAALRIADHAEEFLNRTQNITTGNFPRECQNLARAKILVLSGTGNNGADAVAAGRILLERGWKNVDVSLPGDPKKFSPLLKEQLLSFKEALWVYGSVSLEDDSDENDIDSHILSHLPTDIPYSLIIDGLLGVAFHGALRELYADVITSINQMRDEGTYVLSVDLPSGLYANGNAASPAIHADATVCLGMLKAGLLTFPG